MFEVDAEKERPNGLIYTVGIFDDEDFFVFALHVIFLSGKLLQLDRVLEVLYDLAVFGDFSLVILFVFYQAVDFRVEFPMDEPGVAIQKEHPDNKACQYQYILVTGYPEPFLFSNPL